MATEKITTETEVSTAELACVLGITGRRIRQLAEDGQLNKKDTGVFLLCDSVQKYQLIAAKGKSEPSKDEVAKNKAELSLKQAKAIKSTLEVKELQGKMHRSEDVAAMTEDLIYNLRSALLSLPGRLAVDVSEAVNPAEAAEIIRKEVHRIMDGLTLYRYDPEKYAERVRERQNWDGTAYDDEE